MLIQMRQKLMFWRMEGIYNISQIKTEMHLKIKKDDVPLNLRVACSMQGRCIVTELSFLDSPAPSMSWGLSICVLLNILNEFYVLIFQGSLLL